MAFEEEIKSRREAYEVVSVVLFFSYSVQLNRKVILLQKIIRGWLARNKFKEIRIFEYIFHVHESRKKNYQSY